jgi:hypothetical protein
VGSCWRVSVNPAEVLVCVGHGSGHPCLGVVRGLQEVGYLLRAVDADGEAAHSMALDPVTNQVTTTPDRARRSTTRSDTGVFLTCSNSTWRDAIRRNRQAWHARGQGFESPKLHVSAVQGHISILKMIFDLLHASKKVRG